MLSVLTTLSIKRQRDKEKLREVLDIFTALIVMMVSQVCAYVQTHQIVCIRCIQIFLYIRHTSEL